MRKNRILYAFIMITMLALLAESGMMIFGGAAVIMAIVTGLSCIFIRCNSRRTVIRAFADSSAYYGDELKIRFEVSNNVMRHLTGNIVLELEITNTFIGMTETREIRIPPRAREFEHTVSIVPVCCGNIRIVCTSVEFEDALGIVRRKAAVPGNMNSMISPVPLKVRIDNAFMLNHDDEGEMSQNDKLGSDLSEIVGIREYVPGDQVRAIHWNLTSKTDALYIKQFGESVQHSTLVFMDLSTGNAGCEEIAAAAAATAAITYSLFQAGCLHDIALPAGNGIWEREIADGSDLDAARETGLSVQLPEKAISGLRMILADVLTRKYARIIYVTAGSISEEIRELARECSVTAVVASETYYRFSSAEKDDFTLIEFPVDYSRNQIFKITL